MSLYNDDHDDEIWAPPAGLAESAHNMQLLLPCNLGGRGGEVLLGRGGACQRHVEASGCKFQRRHPLGGQQREA